MNENEGFRSYKRRKNRNFNYNDSEDDIYEIRQCRLENRLYELKRQCHMRLEASVSLFTAQRLGLPDDDFEEAARLPNYELIMIKKKKKRSLWKRFKDLFESKIYPKPTPQPPLPYIPENPKLPLKYRKVRKKHSRILSCLNNLMVVAVASKIPDISIYKVIYAKRKRRITKKMGNVCLKSTASLNDKKLNSSYISSSENISTDYSNDEFSSISVSENSSNEHEELLTLISSDETSLYKESFKLQVELEIHTDDEEVLEFLNVKSELKKDNSTIEKDENINKSMTVEKKNLCKEQKKIKYERKITIVSKRRESKEKISKKSIESSA